MAKSKTISKDKKPASKIKSTSEQSLVSRLFSERATAKGLDNYMDSVEWEQRGVSITDDKGKVIFVQNDIETPKNWSQYALQIVASKYFYGKRETSERETSVRQVIERVSNSFGRWGLKQGYFSNKSEQSNFINELNGNIVEQYGTFNSPVWFNVGLEKYPAGKGDRFRWDALTRKTVQLAINEDRNYPQASACFIQFIDDHMNNIMEIAKVEANLFKWGSGSGSDLSTIRSSREELSGGGKPSGPLSFLKIWDAGAGVIKSGGKTRRAAKMNSLKDAHPDIGEFIIAKLDEEMRAWSLIDQGYSGSFGGSAYGSVGFQNENLSVRVSNEFMQAALENKPWTTRWVTDPTKTGPTYNASDLLDLVSIATYLCGDPGLQFDTTINDWHTCLKSGRINASNPCSEYMFVDDSACNLASLRLTKYYDGKDFNITEFEHSVKTFLLAQDIVVDSASYPTAKIAENSHMFRPLGLGYADLGALLMSMGLEYDSHEGRTVAAVITAAMTGIAYEQSAEMAKKMGPFEKFKENKESVLDVLSKHKSAVDFIDKTVLKKFNLESLAEKAIQSYDKAIKGAKITGLRNAQVTLLAPTGTIGFMMDCDTTGIEPDTALVKYKQLVGGGNMKIANKSVGPALKRLKYSADAVQAIEDYIKETDTIEGAPGLKEEHLSIFDCAFKAKNGKRFIHYKGHVEMMAATQPFLSGAISKTVNLPHDATPEDIRNAYIQGWQKGLKAVAIYRDGSKRTQPLNTSLDERAKDDDAKTIEYVLKAYDLCEKLGLSLDLPRAVYEKKRSVLEGKLNESSPVVERAGPVRRPMPKKRNSYTEKFSISGHEGYYTVGLFDDGTPGEVFVTMAKEGGTIGGLMGQLGTSWSMNLQYGVPLSVILKKMIGSKFDPSGWTEGEDDKDLKAVSSITDYLGKKLKKTFLTGDDGEILDVPRPYYGGLVRSVPTLDSKVKAIKTVATPSLALSTKDDRFLPEYHVLDKYCTNCQNETIYKTDDNCGTICSTCSTIGREGCGG